MYIVLMLPDAHNIFFSFQSSYTWSIKIVFNHFFISYIYIVNKNIGEKIIETILI